MFTEKRHLYYGRLFGMMRICCHVHESVLMKLDGVVLMLQQILDRECRSYNNIVYIEWLKLTRD